LTLTTLVEAIQRSAKVQLTQLIAHLAASLLPLFTCSLGLVGGRRLLLPACVVNSLGTCLALAGRLIALHDLGLHRYRLGALPRRLAEMHLSLVIGPAVDLCTGDGRYQQQAAQQVAHSWVPRVEAQLSPGRAWLNPPTTDGRVTGQNGAALAFTLRPPMWPSCWSVSRRA